MPLIDDVNKLLKDTGVAAPPTGGLRANVDALTAATGLPFTNLKATVEGLQAVVAWAEEVMPKCATELGVTLAGNLAEDMKALREAAGAEKDTLCLELHGLCASLGVTSARAVMLAMKCRAAFTARATPKMVTAPCVCSKGVSQIKGCNATEHPCVCRSMLVSSLDQPTHLCRAKKHDCVCDLSFTGLYSRDPGICNVIKSRGTNHGFSYDLFYYAGPVQGAPARCRQHNQDVINVDEEPDPPAKKAKKERKRG